VLTTLLLATALTAQSVDVPKLFAKQVDRAKERTTVPVLLPETFPSDFKRHYPEGRSNAGGYHFDIGAVRNCHEATACFIADFRGIAGERPGGRRTVRLARGRTGYYHPGSCGASCSPPSIEWRERRSLYVIQAKVGGRKPLVRMANSAIRNGPR